MMIMMMMMMTFLERTILAVSVCRSNITRDLSCNVLHCLMCLLVVSRRHTGWGGGHGVGEGICPALYCFNDCCINCPNVPTTVSKQMSHKRTCPALYYTRICHIVSIICCKQEVQRVDLSCIARLPVVFVPSYSYVL